MSDVNGMNVILAVIIAGLLIAGAVMLAGNNVATSISALQLKAVAVGASTGNGAAAGGNAGASAGAAAGAANAGSAGASDTGVADLSFTGALPSKGPKDAKVTVTEFADFQCPYCGIYAGRDYGGAQYDSIRGVTGKVLSEYVDAGKSVRFVYVPFSFLGQESVRSAEAVFCAEDQGKYWEYHDYLFQKQNGENQGAFADANLKQFAVDLKLDSAAFNSCFDSGKYVDKVTQLNSDVTSKAGVSGTPTVMVNGKQVNPAYTSVKAAIDAALAG
jgi:protein-disulfide isomerase